MRFVVVMSETGNTLYIKHLTLSIQTSADNLECRGKSKGKSKHYTTLWFVFLLYFPLAFLFSQVAIDYAILLEVFAFLWHVPYNTYQKSNKVYDA